LTVLAKNRSVYACQREEEMNTGKGKENLAEERRNEGHH
jgi:hypothetical protein